MHVWIVTMIFPAPRETFAANDVRALARAGLAVSVHALRGAHPRAEALRAEYGVTGIPASSASWRSWTNGLVAALANPRAALSALRFVLQHAGSPRHAVKSLALLPRVMELVARARAERPDVVHLFWGHYPSLFGHVARQALGLPVTLFLGAYDLLAGYPGSIALAQECDAVFTHARANLPALIAAGVPAEKIHVAYRGVDPDLLRAAPAPKIARRVVTAGALEPPKRMDAVLEVFAKVQRRWPDASLEIFGDGPLLPQLEAQVAALELRQVRFRGYRPQGEVFAAMQCAEVFLFLSCADYDRLPNVVKEAVAARCYCVLGTTLGIEELVAGPEEGCVVAEGDWDAAARCIDAAFADPARRARVTERALACLAARFDVDATMAEYRKVWAALAA